MSSPVWTKRRQSRFAARPKDVAAINTLVSSGGTMRDIVRIELPHASDKVCDFVLWELTPFPMVEGSALLPYVRRARGSFTGISTTGTY